MTLRIFLLSRSNLLFQILVPVKKVETVTYKIACGFQNSDASLKEAMRVTQAINLYKGDQAFS